MTVSEVNEVFFDNVGSGSESDRRGKQRLDLRKVLLTHERTILQGCQGKRRLKALKRIAGETQDGFGATMRENASFSSALPKLRLSCKLLNTLNSNAGRVECGQSSGTRIFDFENSRTELAQKMDEMFVELAGYNCLPFVPEQFESGLMAMRLVRAIRVSGTDLFQ